VRYFRKLSEGFGNCRALFAAIPKLSVTPNAFQGDPKEP
jgi:hypothetical protein